MQNQIIGSVKELKTATGTMLVAFPGSAIVESAATTQTNLRALEPPSGWSPEGVPSEEVWKGAFEVTQLLLEEVGVGEYEELITNVNTTLVALDNRAIVESDAIQAYLAKKKAELEAAVLVAPEATGPVAETTVEKAKEIVAEAADSGNAVAEQIQNLPAAQQGEAALAFAQLTHVAKFGAVSLKHLAARKALKIEEDKLEVEFLNSLAGMLNQAPDEIREKMQAALPATAEVTA